MVDIRKLKAQMALHGLNGKQVAEKMGISHQSWYYKCRHQSFSLDDACKLTKLLAIDNPTEIFFADDVN